MWSAPLCEPLHSSGVAAAWLQWPGSSHKPAAFFSPSRPECNSRHSPGIKIDQRQICAREMIKICICFTVCVGGAAGTRSLGEREGGRESDEERKSEIASVKGQLIHDWEM